MAKFFTFKQNNSGGKLVQSDNLDAFVVIEAERAADANKRAEELGIYFDGVVSQRDCPCCGDRWDHAYGAGTASPEVYGKHPSIPFDSFSPYKVKVHYLDGRKEEFSHELSAARNA